MMFDPTESRPVRLVWLSTMACLLGMAGCATTTDAETADIEGNQNARCVITDRAGNEMVVKECIVRMGPEGTPKSVQLPIYETQTKARWGELTYPLNFEVRFEKGKGLVVRLKGTSLGEDDRDADVETPELESEEAEPEVPVREEEEGTEAD